MNFSCEYLLVLPFLSFAYLNLQTCPFYRNWLELRQLENVAHIKLNTTELGRRRQRGWLLFSCWLETSQKHLLVTVGSRRFDDPFVQLQQGFSYDATVMGDVSKLTFAPPFKDILPVQS